MAYTLEKLREWQADFDSIEPSIQGNLASIEAIDLSLQKPQQDLRLNLLECQEETQLRLEVLQRQLEHYTHTQPVRDMSAKAKEELDNNDIAREKVERDLALQQQELNKLEIAAKINEMAYYQQKLELLQQALQQQTISDVICVLNVEVLKQFGLQPELRDFCELIHSRLREREHHDAARLQLMKRKNRLLSENYPDLFHHWPADLFENLFEAIDAMIDEYEKDYPAGQSDSVRKSIFELRNAAEYLNKRTNRDNVRERYCQLMGVVHHVYARLSDSGLALQMLMTKGLLSEHLLDATEAMACFEVYRENEYLLQEAHIEHEYRLADQAYYQQQLRLYNENMYRHNAPVWQPLREDGEKFRDEIIKENKTDKHKFDFNYFGNMLAAARKVIHAPYNEKYRNKFERLLGFNSAGKSNAVRKWQGAGLMLLGAAVAIGSLLVGVSMFGMSSPVMFAGYAAAGVLIVTGLAIFLTGLQKGVDKKGHQLHQKSLFSPPLQQAAPEPSADRCGGPDRHYSHH